MNARERAVMARVYGCLSEMSSLLPSNPADVKAISRNLKLSTQAARCLLAAVEHLGYRELGVAGEYLDDAEKLLKREG